MRGFQKNVGYTSIGYFYYEFYYFNARSLVSVAEILLSKLFSKTVYLK